ncbi:MAG: GNAT family N-acetyltransferase [Planctomycetes bacterium]|nr:GNAT family N-acetyltransferase [Planctomycetota bacterium]
MTAPFASTELAARIERAECDLVRACAESVARRRGEDAIWLRPIGGGLAAFAGNDSPINKVAGLGFGEGIDVAALAEVERELAARGAAVQIELSTLADPEIAPMLCGRGYVLRGFENVLACSLPAASTNRPGAAIVAASPDAEFETWIELVVDGFANPDVEGVPSHESFPRDVMTATLCDVAGAAGFRRYLARLDGLPAGGASMSVRSGLAQMAGAATVPARRRRGVQTALLAARLLDAAAAGCDLAVVTTAPGSKSQQNMQRHGFALLYARAVLVKAPPAAP